MLAVYLGSHRGKARQFETSCTSPYSNPAKELSPLEGVGECSFCFCEEEEKAMEYPCKHSEAEEKRRRLKAKGTAKRGKEKE